MNLEYETLKLLKEKKGSKEWIQHSIDEGEKGSLSTYRHPLQSGTMKIEEKGDPSSPDYYIIITQKGKKLEEGHHLHRSEEGKYFEIYLRGINIK